MTWYLLPSGQPWNVEAPAGTTLDEVLLAQGAVVLADSAVAATVAAWNASQGGAATPVYLVRKVNGIAPGPDGNVTITVGGTVTPTQTHETVAVTNRAAMLALTTSQVQPGDIAVIGSAGAKADQGLWLLTATNPGVIGSWLHLDLGAVVLSPADIGAKTVLTATTVKTAAYTAAPWELVRANITAGSFPVTLPPASSKWEVTVKVVAAPSGASLGSTACTVAAAGTDVINTGATTLPIRYQGRSKTFASDGAGTITVSAGDTDATVEQAINDARYLQLVGGALTGPLTLSGAPTNDLHAATMKWVADQVASTILGPVDVVNATDASTTNLKPLAQAQGHAVMLGSPLCPVALPAIPAGQTYAQILVHAYQDNTGGRGVTWSVQGGGVVNWLGGAPPVLAQGAGALTALTFYVFAGQWYGAPVGASLDTRPVMKIRTTDSAPVNNSIALVADDVLVVPLKANTRYDIRAELYVDSGGAADMLLGWTYPAGATGMWTPDSLSTSATTTQGNLSRPAVDISAAIAVAGVGAGTIAVAKPSGSFKTAGTAGNLVVTYAQATANASNTMLRAGSRLVVTECQ